MGKKKVKPNAFSVFMHEFIAKERRAGRHHTKVRKSETIFSIGCHFFQIVRVREHIPKDVHWKINVFFFCWIGTMGVSSEATLRRKFICRLTLFVGLFALDRKLISRLHWFVQRLSADQKEAYKQKAKMQPARTVVVAPKYTSQGISLDVVEREQRELAEKQKYMERKVNSIVEDAFLENGES